MPNPFESEARAAKVQRLIETIDRISEGVSSERVYAWAKESDSARWLMLAEAAGVNVPSFTTRAQILALLERRRRIAELHKAAS